MFENPDLLFHTYLLEAARRDAEIERRRIVLERLPQRRTWFDLVVARGRQLLRGDAAKRRSVRHARRRHMSHRTARLGAR